MIGKKYIWIFVCGVLALIAVWLANFYGGFGGAGLAQYDAASSGRLVRGQEVVIGLEPASEVRMLKICLLEPKKGTCEVLRDFVAAPAVNTRIVIPMDFPSGKALITTHLRGQYGELPPDTAENQAIDVVVY
jgi:hypothetical protein